MKDTGFWIKPEGTKPRTASMYQQRGGALTVNPSREYFTEPALFSGGGGLVSTAMDYVRFSEMMLNGGELEGVRILKPETVELMHTNQLPDGIDFINPMIGNPGNTFGIDDSPSWPSPTARTDHPLAKGEYWWYGAGGTWFGINPVQDLIVVGMIQKFGVPGPKEVRVTSKRLAYEAIADPAG